MPRQGGRLVSRGRLVSNENGFSLLELVVVIAVLAVLAVGAGLAVGRGVAATERDADRFRRAFEQNWSLAIIGQEPRGLRVTPQGLDLFRVDWATTRIGSTAPQDLRWLAHARLQDWRSRVVLSHDGGPLSGREGPDIVFGTDGNNEAVTVVFSGTGTTPVWRCQSDGWSKMSCAAD